MRRVEGEACDGLDDGWIERRERQAWRGERTCRSDLQCEWIESRGKREEDKYNLMEDVVWTVRSKKKKV